MLDALLLNYSCRVKNPSQAIKSKLASENIVDVEEEDLLEFTNLSHLDVSDNHIQMHKLQNLINLEDLDLQYNSLNGLQLTNGSFARLRVLRLSYNRIPPSHLVELGALRSL